MKPETLTRNLHEEHKRYQHSKDQIRIININATNSA
jgi:hypothetical protein